jgi:hypothetical protein
MIILYSKAWRPALGSTQSPIQWVPWAVTLSLSDGRANLTTHLHLVPRLRIREAICPLCLYLCSTVRDVSTLKLMKLKLQGPSLAWDTSKIMGGGR